MRKSSSWFLCCFFPLRRSRVSRGDARGAEHSFRRLIRPSSSSGSIRVLSANPFTEAELTGEFRLAGGGPIRVLGFADSEDGKLFRLRFSPHAAARHTTTSCAYGAKDLTASLRENFLLRRFADRAGPVIVDPKNPKHFIYMGSGARFHHLGTPHTIC